MAFDSVARLLSRMSSDVYLRVKDSPKLADMMRGLVEVEKSFDGEALLMLTAEAEGKPHTLNKRLQQTLEKLQTAGIELKSVETRESNLERLFLELTGRKLRD